MWGYLIAIPLVFIVSGLKIVNQYERGVVLTLGKYTSTRQPGLTWIFPAIQRMLKVDMRIKVIDVPDQDCMTQDNVSVNVNAVIYYRIASAEKAVLEVEKYKYAVSQLAQTTMRDIVGEVTLDDLLSKRDEISAKIQSIVDKVSDQWGVKVQSVDLKHVELPRELKRVMGKQAEAERERRAVILKSEGEVKAAANLVEAAKMLGSTPGALHLRTLHTLNDLSSDQSNTVIFAVPLEVLRAFERVEKK
ncbi:slipin family protein [Candidatus Parcubacteria bacterium]|nr:MAG: slipin family protein [Candidatus Parcubacteria bacterium]